jgi:hypothetical protein
MTVRPEIRSNKSGQRSEGACRESFSMNLPLRKAVVPLPTPGQEGLFHLIWHTSSRV